MIGMPEFEPLKAMTSHKKMIEPSQTKPKVTLKTSAPTCQLYRWCWTLKAKIPFEPSEPKSIYDQLIPYCKELYFQLENSSGGYLHYQGCLSLKNKEYFHTVKNLIRSDVHLEATNDWRASKLYCQKDETRFMGPWSHDTVWSDYDTLKLFPWQKEIVDYVSDLTNLEDRIVIWIYDPLGNNGKTKLCKYLVQTHNATILNNGGTKDIAHSLPKAPKIVVFNFTRSNEGHINYSAIEAIKDGLIFSPKYESHTKVFESPFVICMANFYPDLMKLSEDRWVIGELSFGHNITFEYDPCYQNDWDC